MSFEYFGEADEPNAAPNGELSRQNRIASLFRLLSQKRLHNLNRQRLEVASDAILEPVVICSLLDVVVSQHMATAAEHGQLPPEVQCAASSYIDSMYNVLDLDQDKARQNKVVTPVRTLGYVMTEARRAIIGDEVLAKQAAAPDNDAARAVEPAYEQAMQYVNEMLADAFDAHAAGRSSGTMGLDNDRLPPGLAEF